MAIEALYLQLLKQAIDRRRDGTPLRALLLAYPDVLLPHAALQRLVGEAARALPLREDARATWDYHGLEGVDEPMVESLALFRAMGVEPEVIDVARLRGMERIVDLNHPLPADLARRFDLVVDTGTCEHCFNVAQAFANCCEALGQDAIL